MLTRLGINSVRIHALARPKCTLDAHPIFLRFLFSIFNLPFLPRGWPSTTAALVISVSNRTLVYERYATTTLLETASDSVRIRTCYHSFPLHYIY